MWNIADIKTRGREAFKLNYWPCVIVSAIYMLLFGGNTSRVTTSVTPDTTTFNVEVNGQTITDFFNNNVDDPTTSVGVIAEGFSDFGRTFVTLLLRDLIIFVGCLVLIFPGFYAMYCFRMVPYIVKDNPELAPMEVLKRSNQMMAGNKWKTFVLDLSFIGWYLLGAITFGLGLIFWTNPYHMSADAALYKELRNQI